VRSQKEWLTASAQSKEEKQREQRVLEELVEWALRQGEDTLRGTTPLEAYVEVKVARKQRERAEAERKVAVEAKLNEFFDWAERRWAQVGRERVRSLDSRHLLTEHPLRTQSQDALTGAVLDWALTHSEDEDLLRKSPSEVALYLLARNSSLATALELGRFAPPHLDYVEKHGGRVELWVHSPRHTEGATRLTKPLRERLAELAEDGKAAVRYFP
jgi:hypothetical protein